MEYKKADYRQVIPYTTKTGIQIGCMYQPKRNVSMSRDMELLQAALLKKPVSVISRITSYLRYPND